MLERTVCPHCGGILEKQHKNPFPTVDIIIVDQEKGIVLVERRFEPLGWALPGGFVDYGESVESAAVREALEETNLTVRLEALLGVYSSPERDPRRHTISTVYIARPENPEAVHGGDDAATARFFPLHSLPESLAFDHAKIVRDFKHTYAAKFGL